MGDRIFNTNIFNTKKIQKNNGKNTKNLRVKILMLKKNPSFLAPKMFNKIKIKNTAKIILHRNVLFLLRQSYGCGSSVSGIRC